MHFLIDPHLPALRAYARALCPDHADAEALMARSLRTATARVAEDEPAIPLRLWLLSVMRRTHFERERLCAPDGAAERPPPGPPGDAEGAGGGKGMEQILSDLPVDLREALVLLFVLGLSHEEVAGLTDTPVAEVNRRAGRAAVLLRMGLAGMRRPRAHVS